MTDQPLPLFFPEALQDLKVLTPRLRALDFSLADLAWLRNVELASHTHRAAQPDPMTVESIALRVKDSQPEPLAGSFMLHPTPVDQKAVLYTPYGGLQKFDNPGAAIQTLQASLKDPGKRLELLRLLPIAWRHSWPDDNSFSLSHEVIDEPVFEHQGRQFAASQRNNLSLMREQLEQLPTLSHLLEQLLDRELGRSFPGLDQRQSRVEFFALDPEGERRKVDSKPLTQALLDFFLHRTWPAGLNRRFANPRLVPTADDPAPWENAVKGIAQGLAPLLAERLRSYWATDAGVVGSRLAFFAQAMSDKARLDLLRKRQEQILSPEQHQVLLALLERGNAPAGYDADQLQAETVRVWEQPEQYVEPASTLLLSNRNSAYLYSQSQGVQVLSDYAQLKQTVQRMVTSSGHEDQVYSLLSLPERNLLLRLDEPQVSGEPVFGNLFQRLVSDIISKQQQSISHALDVFRNSEGAIDLPALFDQSLDVRAMLDSALLEPADQQRWSLRPLISGEHHPSIRATDRAELHLKSLQSVRDSLAEKLAALPADNLALQQTFLEGLKPDLGHAMAVGIRGEAALRQLPRTFSAHDKAIVDTALNPDTPTRRQRNALRGFRPDAWSLTLLCSGEPNLMPLANCLLLTERGGLDPSHSGRAILWTPAQGLEAFASITHARLELDKRLLDEGARLELLENLPRDLYRPHRSYTLGPFRLIEGHVLQERQQSAINHFIAARRFTRSLGLPDASLRADWLRHKSSPTPLNLEHAMQIARGIITQRSLPAWLGAASAGQMQQHAELLEQFRLSLEPGGDYLHDVQPLSGYVAERLKQLLRARFPGAELDPDQMQVTPTLALNGPVQTLTEFALNPTHVLHSAGFAITSGSALELPAQVTASEVRKLLLQLDIKTAYREQLTRLLTGNTRAVLKRQQRFVRQLPWQLRLHAHALNLQGNLSEQGLALVEQVLDMPDALARASVSGAKAIVRPLELIATQGAATVKALGLYLIGEHVNGPQVLYAPYDKHLGITEYANTASVVSAINHPGPLQDLLLRRLPAPHQATYQNLLGSGPDSDIQLACHPIEGNLLHRLFADNSVLLSHLLGSHLERSAAADWDALKALFAKGMKYGGAFLPGKLAIPLALWQSYTSFKQSAEALQDHHWKTVLPSFINGIAQLVRLGRLLHVPVGVSRDTRAIDLCAPARTRLQPFEATQLALSGERAADGSYPMAVGQHYAPVAGKVYPISKKAIAPRIVETQRQGPYLLNQGTQWLLDPDVNSVHYGKALSKLHSKLVTRQEVRRLINIEARGMEKIRQLFPEKARQIVQALDLARFYAFNSLHNLAQLKSTQRGARLEVLFKEMFDVDSLNESLLRKIKEAIVPLCKALVDPSLDSLDHDRFVVGSNLYPTEGVIAFVVSEDAQRAVHFTEHFFNQQLDMYEGALTEAFDITAHAQAATLIHEFSHLFSNTYDFATVESRRPFSDLISTLTHAHRLLKATHETFQREALSLRTPAEELFAYWNREEQTWESFDDALEARQLRNAVRSATGAANMQEARTAFFNPDSPDRRTDTILRNADSVARLVCEMGRRLDPVPGMDEKAIH